MNLNKPRTICTLSILLLSPLHLSCQHQDYRLEVSPGQQGQAEVHRVPFTAEEQAARDREEKVRAALAQKSDTAVAEPDLATLESLWPRLSAEDRAAVLELAKRAAAQQQK